MKKEKLKELMENSLERAKGLLLEDGRLVPVAFLHYENNIDIIGLSFRDNDEKVIQTEILKKLVKEKNADAIFMITESWHVTSKNKEDLGMAPSEHPMRKECIFLIGECEYGRIAIIQSFERENDKIVFGEKFDIGESAITRFDFGLKDKKYMPTDVSLN